jgi:hypothetical protein
MKKFTLPLAKIVFCLFVLSALETGPAYAQWPLGKELASPEPKTESSPQVTGSGRFQIFVSPQTKGFTFMIDTETGKIWVMKRDHTAGEFSLQRVHVEEIDAQTAGKTEKSDKSSNPEAQGKSKKSNE